MNPHDLNDTIRTLGQLLDDLETVRIANGNRINALEREYGEALPHLDVIQKQVRAAEHLAELELIRAWRKHPLAPWAKDFRGVGEKSIARLVAIVGDPGGRPNVAKLWAYCGHGNPDRKRAKGMTQAELFKLGNPAAKKQTWLIATALLKSGNRDWYDQARDRYADRVHERSCVRCGPSGHPALPGSPWSDGHKHAAALRYVGKMFLKELWLAARAKGALESKGVTPAPPRCPTYPHETPGGAGQVHNDAHVPVARAAQRGGETHSSSVGADQRLHETHTASARADHRTDGIHISSVDAGANGGQA